MRPTRSYPRRPRTGRFYATALLYFATVACLLLIVSYLYLRPAASIYNNADAHDKKRLAAVSLVFLLTLLLILVLAIVWGLHASQFFSRRKDSRPKPTKYVDAWSESANRLETPPKDENKERDD